MKDLSKHLCLSVHKLDKQMPPEKKKFYLTSNNIGHTYGVKVLHINYNWQNEFRDRGPCPR